METGMKYGLSAGVIALFLLAGCGDRGPSEETGREIDEAVEEAEEAIDGAVQEAEDAIDPPGPGERTGRAIDDAAEEARDRIDEITDN